MICGDFNVDHISDNLHKRQLIDLFASFGGISIVDDPTRRTIHSCTQIDNIFTNLSGVTCAVEVCNFSDHNVIHFCKNHNQSFLKHFDIATVRKITTDDLRLLKELLMDEAWIDMYAALDGRFNSFLEIFMMHLNSICPLRKIQIKRLTKPEWITSGIKKSSETLDDLKYLNTHSRDVLF